MRYRELGASLLSAALLLAAAPASGQAGPETFSATATAKTAGGAGASAPVTITIARTTPEAEASTLVAAFKAGGAAALRKGLAGIPQTGTIKVGDGAAVPSRIVIARGTPDGRLLTIVADRPVLFLGASLPGAKPKEGYDFAVIDLVVDAKGSGTGSFAPAAKIRLSPEGAFVVEDYGVEAVRLTAVKKTK